MTRLTKSMKENICENALAQSSVNKELVANKEKEQELAVEIYNDNVTAEDLAEAKNISERMEKLPFYRAWGVFQKKAHLSCNLGNNHVYLSFPDNNEFYEIANSVTYDKDHEFCKRFADISREKDKLKEQKENLTEEIMAVLNSCQTLKRLLEVWPESSNFLNGLNIITLKAGLPAITIEDLNKKLGINSD